MTASEIQYFNAEKACPRGPYSHAAVHNGTVYVASQVGLPPEGEEIGSCGVQTERALNCIREILLAAGTDLSRLLKVNIYLAPEGDFAEMNEAYVKVLGDARPPRSTIPIGQLSSGQVVAIDAVAAV